MSASDHGHGDSTDGGEKDTCPAMSKIVFESTAPPPLVTDFAHEAGDWSAFEPLEDSAVEALQAAARHVRLGPDSRAVTIVFADDATVRSLNRAWRGQDKPTNVLSFPAPQTHLHNAGNEPVLLGDVVLAAETVISEAADLGVAPLDHLRHLLVHGFLHLLGYDHMQPEEADAMERLETEILADIGIADPYQNSEPIDAEH